MKRDVPDSTIMLERSMHPSRDLQVRRLDAFSRALRVKSSASLTTMAALSSSAVFERNPYEGHPNLTELEAEVLWEYAKLSQNVKDVSHNWSLKDPLSQNATSSQLITETRRLSEAPDETLLKRLRSLEMKMGLVLTLVRTIHIISLSVD